MRWIILLSAPIVMSAGAEVRIENTAWQGWPNCRRITNGVVEMIVTTDVGPRVMRYGFVGGPNLLKEIPEELGGKGEKDFKLRGGHRLWVAPENLKTSWAVDNGPVTATIEADALTLAQPVDSAGIEKRISIRMSATGSVELAHSARNTTGFAVEMAPWTLTMMAQGGLAITGFPPRGKHPEVLLPTNPLVMWAYTDLADPRWKITRKYLTLRQDPKRPEPQKIGLFNADTWAAYLLGDNLYVKRVKADPAKSYPDFGCSFETFTNADFLELETLGPLTRLAPGAAAELTERWSLHRGVRVPAISDEVLDREVLPLIGK